MTAGLGLTHFLRKERGQARLAQFLTVELEQVVLRPYRLLGRGRGVSMSPAISDVLNEYVS